MVKKFLDKKYTKISLFLLLLLISGFTFYFLVRAENPDDNKFTVNGLKVTSVVDGTSDSINPDTSEEVWVDSASYDKSTGANPGMDNSPSNGVVRTFDSIKYNLKFNLVAKDGETVDTSSPRTVIVDVLIPGNIDGFLSSSSDNMVALSHSSNGAYAYGEMTYNVEPNQDITRVITLSRIDGDNNASIEPIFIIRESTDASTKSLSTFSEEQLAEIDFATTTEFAYVRSDSYCETGVICNTTVTGVENYNVELYNANSTRDGVTSSTTPIGIGVSLETSQDKGIKGLLIPQTLSYTIALPSNAENYSFSYLDGSVKNYNSLDPSSADPFIAIDADNDALPSIGNGTPTASTSTECSTGNCLNVTISGIGHNYEFVNNKYYITTTILSTTLSRNNYTSDINYSLVANYGSKTSNTLDLQDKVGKFVGKYDSKVNFYDPDVTVYDSANRKPDGFAVLNYGQQFEIESYSQYGMTSGTELDELTNYIKIDNDAIKVINDTTSNLPIQVTTSNGISYEVTYGFGQWNSTYFAINSNDSSCSSIGSIDDLSKEELMNLYGGPCIVTTEAFKWSTSATEATEQFDDQDLIDYGPLVVKVDYAKGEEMVPSASSYKEVVFARIKKNPELTKTTHQVVTNSTALFTDDSNNTQLYYLSNEVDSSATEMMKNKNNFNMTNYDYDNRTMSEINSAAMCDTLTCAITGNSLLVSALRVNTPTISTYYEGLPTTEFYYYPMEWQITASSYFYTPSSISYESGVVYVDIPNYLNLVNYGDSRLAEEETSPFAGYKRYKYSFTGDELTENNGVVTFSVFTNISLNTEDGIQPTIYATADFTVSDNANQVSSAITPDGDRQTSQTVTIHNASSVGLQGVTTPALIEKGGTFTYNVKAYNNSVTPDSTGIAYENPVAYYILPYNNDSSYEEYSSSFNNSKVKFKVSIQSLPAGYRAYYTTDSSSSIINNEVYATNGTTSWVEWTNTSNEITGPTGIKIVKTSSSGTPSIAPSEYFGGENGITFNVKTTGSETGNRFYNAFYLLTDKPRNADCNPETMSEDEYEYCMDTTKFLFSSSRTLTSVYSREISGFVWEDYDYTGLYDNLDNKLSNIPVSVCKSTATEFDPENPSTYVTDNDECVADTTTGLDGSFLFRGLAEGNYYVKYVFDNEKYLVADKRVVSPTETDSNSINSKAAQLPNKNIAISSLITFTNKNTKEQYVNLGLRIKKQFSIDIKKYITNIVVSDDNGTDSYDYDNATKVTLNFRNPRNAKVRVKYSFSIENIKYFPGYVGIIADKIPNGMTFDPTLPENQDWVLFEDTVYYNGLSGKILSPNEPQYFTLVLDLDVNEGGNYINVVAARELVLMGDELPEYDFTSLNLFSEPEEGGE